MKIFISLSMFRDAETKEQVIEVLESKGIDYKVVTVGGTELLVFDDKVIDDFDFVDPQPFEEWIYSGTARSIVRELESDLEQAFNDGFWKHPPPVYHATKEARIEEILAKGLLPSRETRGLNNRHIQAAVFTSLDADSIDSYGPVLITVDTLKMKHAGHTSFVSREPEVVEAEAMEHLAHLLGVEFQAHIEDNGVSTETVIFSGKIAPEFLKID